MAIIYNILIYERNKQSLLYALMSSIYALFIILTVNKGAAFRLT